MSRYISLTALLTLLAGVALAADWPMSGGVPSRNGANHVEKNLPNDWNVTKGKEKNVKWTAQIGTRGYVSPTVAGGRVYLATNNGRPRDPAVKGAKAIMMCFDEATGKFLWQIVHEMPPPAVVTQAKDDGLLSTPTVVGDRLYYLAPAGEIVCASTAGKVLWTYDLMKSLNVHPCYVSFCAPIVAENHVFVVTGNGVVGGEEESLPSPEAPSFVAVHKETGKLAWKDSSPGKNVMEGQWASPAYAQVNGKSQIIFPGGDGWLYGFEPKTGKLLWKFDCNPKDAVWKAGGKGTKNYLMAPVVHDNKVFTGVGQNPDNGVDVSYLWCVDITKTGDLSEEIAVGMKNPNSGLVWKFGGKTPPGSPRDFFLGRSISAPVIHDGLLFMPEQDGFLHCLEAATGKHLWQEDLKATVWASALWADGKVYLGDDQGFVHVFASDRTKKQVGKVEMEQPIKASLVAANGTLYIVGDKTLYAIAIK